MVKVSQEWKQWSTGSVRSRITEVKWELKLTQKQQQEKKKKKWGFQPSKSNDSKESNSEVGLWEDGFKIGMVAFQNWDDFVAQCLIWAMALSLDGRKLAFWEWVWKAENDAFEVEVKFKEWFPSICVPAVWRNWHSQLHFCLKGI